MQDAQHHAYIYEGSLSLHEGLVAHARGLFGFEEPGNPDVQVFLIEKFGIEEARELVHTASLKSTSGRGLFVVSTSSITSDAQQALLKLLEEPPQGVIFVLLLPYGSIIATLRSRMSEYPEKVEMLSQKSSLQSTARSRAGFQTFAQASELFLHASTKDRSTEITKLLKDEEGAKERVRGFLDGLEVTLHEVLIKTKGDAKIRQGLEDIAKVRSYVGDRSPSMKMLLEHLAVSLPTIK